MTGTEEPIPPAPPLAAGASFGRRVVALCIDLFALAFLNAAFLSQFGGSLFRGSPHDLLSILLLSATLVGTAIIIPPLLGLAYCTIFSACGGQTIGKLLLGIKVVAREGGALSWGRSFLRAVGQLASALPLGAGFLWALVDREGRAWHDHLAMSRVVEVEKSLDKEPAFQ